MPAQISLQVLLLLWISNGALGQSGCSDCSLTNGQYACVSETDYGFCFDQGTVDESAVRSCRDGYYCVLEGFCAPMASAEPACVTATSTATTDIVTDSSTDSTTSATTTDSSSPPTTTESSTSAPTTVPSEIDPNAYCAKLKAKGYFRVETDTTCQMYVYCYKLSLDYLGWLYYCNTNEYYNSETESCQSTRPSNC
ncbi:uncharacterized protein LOC6736586 isoform X3 [Drosophila simulans]|uniref:uncharacterized protein LOC6736586 isoform X3 n=1 Tax=Drosophila simulans TaxID=7240 RepID=UPI001D11AE44|nr:uncharacterized protein LOC6736586 isoform X3 [Drosophila simulans]